MINISGTVQDGQFIRRNANRNEQWNNFKRPWVTLSGLVKFERHGSSRDLKRTDESIVPAVTCCRLVPCNDAYKFCREMLSKRGLCCLVYRPTYWIASSRFSTLQLGRSPVYVAHVYVTDTLASFHWLRAPERISFKLAVLVYRALHGTAPRYLSDFLCRVADLPSRCRLRSATSNQLDVRPSRLVTVGDRSFGSVGPKLWNCLPDDITSASSLSVFRKKLKTHLFQQSYPDIIL